MKDDPIVRKIHLVREKIHEKYGGDFDLYLEHVRLVLENHRDRVVTREDLARRRKGSEILG